MIGSYPPGVTDADIDAMLPEPWESERCGTCRHCWSSDVTIPGCGICADGAAEGFFIGVAYADSACERWESDR